MFTGLVEACGKILGIDGADAQSAGAPAASQVPLRLRIASPWCGKDTPQIGDSIAIDGTCLTVVVRDEVHGALCFEAATETLVRTTLGRLVTGDTVHLERALPLGARLGGHMVSGHVDGVGRVHAREQRGSALYLQIDVPTAVAKLSTPQGAITLAGVSLTITDVVDTRVSVAIIPHTLSATCLGQLQVGDSLNCEADLLARYMMGLLERQPQLLQQLAARARGDGGLP